MNDIFIRLVRFPSLSVPSAVMMDPEGDYNIYIDERLSPEARYHRLNHEIRHIAGHHFDDDVIVSDAEKEANE